LERDSESRFSIRVVAEPFWTGQLYRRDPAHLERSKAITQSIPKEFYRGRGHVIDFKGELGRGAPVLANF
jgi:hypothetical protein